MLLDRLCVLFVLVVGVIVATQQKRAAFASLRFICEMTYLAVYPILTHVVNLPPLN